MTSRGGSRSSDQRPLEDYKAALMRYTITTSPEACSRSYVRVSKLIEWWESDTKTQGHTTSQARRLLTYAYQDFKKHNPITKDKLFGNPPCILIFSILVEIGWGDLIHLFRLVRLDDSHLPLEESSLKARIHDMAHFHERFRQIPVEETFRLFYDAQWKYCAAKFDGEVFYPSPLQIIPIHKKVKISDKGGTAKLYQIEVLSEFVCGQLQQYASDFEYTPNDDTRADGPRYHFALKVYNSHGGEERFQNEKGAFAALKDHNGMVRYLGGYGQIPPNIVPGEPEEMIYHLILEYGDRDLDDLFFYKTPPILDNEIEAFWNNLFELAEAVNRIHNLTTTDDNFKEKYFGWHADIKPDNILEIGGKFKLADPGFARFLKHEKGKDPVDPRVTMSGGTYSFGAPELYRELRGSVKAHQTIDVWSLGCVFSIAATWVALDYDGIKRYRKLRERAIDNLISKREEEQLVQQDYSSPELHDGDYFHDGINVLPEVTDWHKYLRVILRRTDNSTSQFLDLVDKCMLVGSPDARIKSSDLCNRLEAIRLDPGPLQSTVPGSIRKFLDDLDEAILNNPNASTISYDSVPRGLPSHSTFTDRQNQKSRYLSAPLTRTTQRSQSTTGRRESKQIAGSTIHEEESSYGSELTKKFTNPEHAIHDPVSPNNDMQRRRSSRNSSTPTGSYPRLSIDEARIAMDEERKNKSSFSKLVFKSKPDVFLSRHYVKRDIKFLIDNSSSMEKYWPDVKFVLETLLMKVKGLDDNGVDVSFTEGAVQVVNLKDRRTILAKMDQPDVHPSQGGRTDLLVPLGNVLKGYKEDIELYHRRNPKAVKSATLFVLSDGNWQNTAKEVGDKIVGFIKDYQRIMKSSYGDQQFSIQFVQFGYIPEATETFYYLDDKLKEEQGIPDIVDHEHRDGDIFKILLGSFKKDYDENQYEDSIGDQQADDLSLSPTQSEDPPSPVYKAQPRRPTLPSGRSPRPPSDGGPSSSQAGILPRRSATHTVQGTPQSTEATNSSPRTSRKRHSHYDHTKKT